MTKDRGTDSRQKRVRLSFVHRCAQVVIVWVLSLSFVITFIPVALTFFESICCAGVVAVIFAVVHPDNFYRMKYLRFQYPSVASVFDEQHAAMPSLERFVLLVVPIRSREHLIGDLEEEYRAEIAGNYGRFETRCWWLWQVLGVVRPYLWRRLRRWLGLDFTLRVRR